MLPGVFGVEICGHRVDSVHLSCVLKPLHIRFLNLFQTKALLDSQMNILEEKIRLHHPILQALKSSEYECSLNAENVDNVKAELDAKKRRNVFGDSIMDKKLRDDNDNSGNDEL